MPANSWPRAVGLLRHVRVDGNRREVVMEAILSLLFSGTMMGRKISWMNQPEIDRERIQGVMPIK